MKIQRKKILQGVSKTSIHGSLLICMPAIVLSLFMTSSRMEARPFSNEATALAQSYTVKPGRGPFQYAYLFDVEQDQEGEPSLGIIFRSRTAIHLYLKQPLRLPGFTASIRLRLEGFRGGETIYALFADRRGKTHRLPMGRIDSYGFQEWKLDLRGKLVFRPQRMSEESYVDFLGWSIEPDLRQPERSAYILMRRPVFDVRPYDMRVPLKL
jgi:hypothetical protein